MKCWWCDDDISNTVAHIKTHCKDKHNVTECNNVIMQKVCTLMRNPNLLKRSMNSSAKLCYICGLLLKNQWIFINHCLKRHAGTGIQRGAGVVDPYTRILRVKTELPVKILVTHEDIFNRYQIVATKEDFPTDYGWGVSGSVMSFLTVATQELNSLLLTQKMSSDRSALRVDNLKITFSAVIQNQQELGFGMEPEILPARRWYAQTVESAGMLAGVREYFKNSINSRILYNAETGSSVHFRTFLEFRMDIFVDIADDTIANVFGGNEDVLKKMLVNYSSSSDNDSDDDIHFIPRKKGKVAVSVHFISF